MLTRRAALDGRSHRFGCRLLTPIAQITVAVKAQLSPATPGHIFIDVKVEATEKDSAKKEKDSAKKKIEFWCVDSVAAALVLELNAIGKNFVRRRIAGKLNTIWVVLGGDKGGKPEATFKLGFSVLNQPSPVSSLNVTLLGVVHGPDKLEVLIQTVMTPKVSAQLAHLKQSVVLHVVVAHPGCDPAHSSLVVPKEMAVATTVSSCPVLLLLGEGDTPRTAPGRVEAPASECVGIFALCGGLIVRLVVFHCNKGLGRSLVLDIVATAGACLTLTAACALLGDVVAFYGFAEELHRGAVVFFETLDLNQKLTADHELFRVVYGQQGAKARMPCWACKTLALDERQGAAPAEERTLASLYACAALFPKGAKAGTTVIKANAFCSIEHEPLLPYDPCSTFASLKSFSASTPPWRHCARSSTAWRTPKPRRASPARSWPARSAATRSVSRSMR